MNEGLWIIALLAVAVCWAVLAEAHSARAVERDRRRLEREEANAALRAKQEERYASLRMSGKHILDRKGWASSVDRAPSLQRRATLTVLKGAKR